MPEVNVEINGRKYRMACEEGQQKHLIGLAKRFDAHVEGLKGAVGEIGDTRLTVMAGIAVLDELAEAEKRIKALEGEVSLLTQAGQEVALEYAADLARQSPQAIRMLKFAFNLADDGLAGQQVFAGEATRLAYMTDEAVEGKEAFLEKRDPDWSQFPYYF